MTTITIPSKKFTLEQVGLANTELFPVDGELARRYNAVLKAVFGWESELDSFRVDKRGLSPEQAQHLKQKYPDHRLLEFGENYLNIRSANRYMVVVSPEQATAPLIAPQTSYEGKLYLEVFSQARHTIEDVTASEVMFGELQDGGIDVFETADDLLHLRTVEVSLDTLQGTMRDYFELKRLSEGLGKTGEDGIENALNSDYVKRMRDLVSRVGDPRRRSISKVFPITKEVHCFYVEFFKGVHCLRNFKNRDDISTLLITHHQGNLTEKNLGPEIMIRDLRDENLISMLHGYKFLKYNADLLETRIREIEDEALLAAGVDVVSISDSERKRKITEMSSCFISTWRELREIAKIMRNSDDVKLADVLDEKNAGYITRLKLSEATPNGKPEIINHMLAELDPTDPIRMYLFNKKKLIVEFPQLSLPRQRYIALRLLTKLHQEETK